MQVAPDLRIPNYPALFVVGDMAHPGQEGRPLPGWHLWPYGRASTGSSFIAPLLRALYLVRG
ncbi:MAG TPA: hypothetical protein VIH59_04300, partial [Candidatus Tectomicrobia bacterium]